MLSVEDAQAIDQLIVFVQCSNGFGKRSNRTEP